MIPSLFYESQSFMLAGTQQLDVKDRPYRLFIYQPDGPIPSEGFPVIYVLDGNAIFATMVEALRLQSSIPEKTGVTPAVIVGIGYKTDQPHHPQRHEDFTHQPPDQWIQTLKKGASTHSYGGAPAFFTFLEEQVKPMIEARYSINRGRQTLFGHSLGGLFTLSTLFEHPEAFQTYIAGSPSIHWYPSFLLQQEQSFQKRLKQQMHQKRLLIGVGELEQDHICQMNHHAQAMKERLSVYSPNGVHVHFMEFSREGHSSVLPVLMNEALRFALYPSESKKIKEGDR
ncbi:alpha/beta hydrolase [Bacillus sp. 28A-2]|uniref:alpha/beta hydrolase n=1 Tax=Bacillus sp. 28A-2 TaxID=2772252 RepID=UPI00168D1145|nr:alpha/beta hydrolase-fold protein [Bacillus sp. 28A-2]MBD3861142.1 alpha/beta hydrolase [Bacillus sp. 28A-2]